MGAAKLKQRLRDRRTKKWPLPDHFAVVGADRYGEPFRSEEPTFSAAEKMAEGVNRRGGTVRVVREIYNGPAATWLPENHWRFR